MISYNIVKLIKKKENNAKTLVDNYCEKYRKSINENLIMDNDYEEINDIAEYESLNMGINLNESNETLYDNFLEKVNKEKEEINRIINKKKNDMVNFAKDIQNTPIPEDPNEENQYRILSFPWCISGHILSFIKFLNLEINN